MDTTGSWGRAVGLDAVVAANIIENLGLEPLVCRPDCAQGYGRPLEVMPS